MACVILFEINMLRNFNCHFSFPHTTICILQFDPSLTKFPAVWCTSLFGTDVTSADPSVLVRTGSRLNEHPVPFCLIQTSENYVHEKWNLSVLHTNICCCTSIIVTLETSTSTFILYCTSSQPRKTWY